MKCHPYCVKNKFCSLGNQVGMYTVKHKLTKEEVAAELM